MKADSVLVSLPQKKVLLLTIQGAKGAVLKKADLPNIKTLLPHSIYSWDAVCDTISTDHASWASLFTGVRVTKSNIMKTCYRNNHFDKFPAFFEKIQLNKPLQITQVNDIASLNDTLFNSRYTLNIKADNDKAVKDSIVNRLKTGDPDLLAASFKSVNVAGQSGGFSETNIDYIQALKKIDDYIGEILTALRNRKSHAQENWLVIITSNHGGKNDGSYGMGSFEERNSFVIYSNLLFSEHQIKKPLYNVPYSGSFPFFYRKDGKDHAAFVANPLFDFGANQDFTIEFNIHADTAYKRRDNPIITNKSWTSGSNPGWIIYLQDGNIRVNYKGDNSGRKDLRNGPVVVDGQWHHITITFDRAGAISIYKDGEFYIKGPSIKDNGDINTNYPLVIGTHGPLNFKYYGVNTGSLDAYISDVRIWDNLLSPDVIKKWSFIPVTHTHPDYAHLLANWRLKEGSIIKDPGKDSGPNNIDLTIQYGLAWSPVNDVLNPSAIDATQSVPHSVDVAVNVMAWLGVKIQPDWGLDGRLWILQ